MEDFNNNINNIKLFCKSNINNHKH